MSEDISREEIAALLARESMSEGMTREQAIRVMENEKPHCGKKITFPESIKYEAYNMAIAALEAELATKTCNKQIASKLEDAELARDSEGTCNNKQVISKLVASEDAISREDAIEEIRFGQSYITKIHPTGELEELFVKENQALEDAIKRIEQLPPVQPIRPRGRWVLKRTFTTKLYDEYLNEYQCSECYRGIRCTESQLVNYPFCHCGADMREDLHDES